MSELARAWLNIRKGAYQALGVITIVAMIAYGYRWATGESLIAKVMAKFCS